MLKISVPIVLLLLLLLFDWSSLKVRCDSIKSIIRQTQNGPIEGIEQMSALNQRIYAFFGVPYAEPPITGINPYTGEQIDNRFKVCC